MTSQQLALWAPAQEAETARLCPWCGRPNPPGWARCGPCEAVFDNWLWRINRPAGEPEIAAYAAWRGAGAWERFFAGNRIRAAAERAAEEAARRAWFAQPGGQR